MKYQAIIPICAALGLTFTSGNAAVISWSSGSAATSGSAGQTLNSGLFLTTGTLILAENSGGAATTFDGISFTAGTITFSGGGFGGFHDSTQDLSRTGTYGNSGASTVGLNGLTVGHTYRVQALIFDGRGSAGITGRTVSFDGINQGTYANGTTNITWGTGLLVTGTFVADASTQNFTIEAFNGSSSVGGQLNALTVYQTAVPETSCTLLGAIGALILLRRRR